MADKCPVCDRKLKEGERLVKVQNKMMCRECAAEAERLAARREPKPAWR
jgi:hypothetical protein